MLFHAFSAFGSFPEPGDVTLTFSNLGKTGSIESKNIFHHRPQNRFLTKLRIDLISKSSQAKAEKSRKSMKRHEKA
jgi:hypothetical protein